MKTNKQKIQQLTGIGLFTAIVIVLQFLGSFIRLGPFSISLVLLPIVIGTALYGVRAGAWLGFAFGVIVLVSGDAAAFLTVDAFGTILTVLVKGTLAGLVSGLVFRALSQKNDFLATVVAAIVCPIVNTGVFLLGCAVFFMDTLREWATGWAFGLAEKASLGTATWADTWALGLVEKYGDDSLTLYIIVGLVGLNFLAEFFINLLLSPTIVRIIGIGKKYFKKS